MNDYFTNSSPCCSSHFSWLHARISTFHLLSWLTLKFQATRSDGAKWCSSNGVSNRKKEKKHTHTQNLKYWERQGTLPEFPSRGSGRLDIRTIINHENLVSVKSCFVCGGISPLQICLIAWSNKLPLVQILREGEDKKLQNWERQKLLLHPQQPALIITSGRNKERVKFIQNN